MSLPDIRCTATHLNQSLESIHDEYCTPVLDSETNGPLSVVLKANSVVCPFNREGKCVLGEAKPFACRIAPLTRNFVPMEKQDGAWRVAYYLVDGGENLGTVKRPALTCLAKAGAAETENAFGHLHIAMIEANKSCSLLYELTGKPFDRKTMELELRKLMTQWNSFGDLTQNAVKNRNDFECNVVNPTEDRVEKILQNMTLSAGWPFNAKY